MTAELVERRHFRKEVPKEHRASLDTRLRWLWNQRFGTVQTVWKDSAERKLTMEPLWHYATVDSVTNVMLPYVESEAA